MSVSILTLNPRTSSASTKDNAVKTGDEALWYKDAIFYELRVRTFFDSDGDGVGDFKGLTQKLDYLQDLGVTAIWLLPFYPSPLRDDGYDISDYTAIHPDVGTLEDFREFLNEAHARGLKVITELVLNHTSDQHPWFLRARKAPPGSKERDFYVWSDTPEKYKDARIIFKDFELSNWTWDPVARAYYWHRFFSHQPDLNFDNPEVHKAVFGALDFWLGMGVDGLRLDAVPYLYEREGTNCENLPETHLFLKKLRQHVDAKYENRMILAEANQWPDDARVYFGNGDGCHMAFNFPLMPRMFMAVHMEDRYPIIDIFDQTPQIPENCQWALFLRNHDELTLEMVTEEERDYMYKVYAQDAAAKINLGIRRRLAPLLGNNRRKIELMNGLLLSLQGTPVLYYGDEIGMGDNIYLGDRNGVRTPMQWSGDRNAGFSIANPQRLYLPVITDPENHYATVNVETQQGNLNSFLWWMKRLVALRKKYHAFGRGTIEFLQPNNPKVVTFLRQHGKEKILVVANLSRFVQYVELDLSAYRGMRPLELFGRVKFPPIGELPYFITLGPHSFYWFSLEPQNMEENAPAPTGDIPTIRVKGDWKNLFQGRAIRDLEEHIPGYLKGRRWFGGKSRVTKQARIIEHVDVNAASAPCVMTFVFVEYDEGNPEIYTLPLAYATGDREKQILQEFHSTVLVHVEGSDGSKGILYDALVDNSFSSALFDLIKNAGELKGVDGVVAGQPMKRLAQSLDGNQEPLEPSAIKREQSNTSVMFGKKFIMKIVRRLEPGINPDLEIGEYLTNLGTFKNISPIAGHLEYRRKGNQEPVTLAILQEFVPNQGDALSFTRDELGRYFERAFAKNNETGVVPLPSRRLLELAETPPTDLAKDLIGTYLAAARLLGKRTAELHRVLATPSDDPDFGTEPLSPFLQRAIFQSMRGHVKKVFTSLKRQLSTLKPDMKEQAQRILDEESAILSYMRGITNRLSAIQIRCHGDFHLGQILYTGNDFYIIDFEGEPTRSLTERKLKRSPLRDVAGMIRSFHYAVHVALNDQASRGFTTALSAAQQEAWAEYWFLWVSATFLKSYLDTMAGSGILPEDRSQLELLLNVFIIDKAVFELGYEINNRPDWISIPIKGLQQLLTSLKGNA